MADIIFTGKFRLCSEIGRGKSSVVYLAVHQELEEYRAIKRISKTSADYQQFLREARMLRDLKHQGIPVIYDLAEDEEFSYLIEEFLSGDTLWVVVSTQGPLSRAMTISYGIQICRLVNFLHSRTNPILFLDLHPQNLILCNGILKMVDFGQAICAGDTGQLTKKYGSVGFAAPEQYTKEVLDERTDLYAIGAVLYFMYTGIVPESIPSYSDHSFDLPLEQVLRRCLASSKDERYASVKELEIELAKIANVASDDVEEQTVLSLEIAVVGAKHGAGATQVAIGLAAFLWHNGITCLYEEKNSSGVVRQMADWFCVEPDRLGRIMVKGIPFLPKYGPAMRKVFSEEHCVVKDYGTDWSSVSLHQTDVVLLVSGSRWWEQALVEKACEALRNHPGFAIIYNHVSGQSIRLPSQVSKTKCFPMPYVPDPFQINSQTLHFYQNIFNTMLHGRRGIAALCCEESFWKKIKGKLSAWKRKQLGL